ncbi:MAG: ABC transporter substrate-binding protein [Desulfurococcales archaeon ex4484_42]|nr:MAG: ABC transporter substrate-binding protein [Desulfurococcales archaeon ex4484_42]
MNEIIEITLRSIYVSGLATLLSLSISIPSAYYLSRNSGIARVVIPVFEALIGVPTVFIGLTLYMLLSTRGPLGFLKLLYTPYAIIIGESILVFPLITAVIYRVMHITWVTYGELAITLGANERQTLMLIAKQALPGIIAASIMGFSRAIGELGIALLVGGNIRGYTRVLTTAIALEVSKGSFEVALTLGLILIVTVLSFSALSRVIERWYGL